MISFTIVIRSAASFNCATFLLLNSLACCVLALTCSLAADNCSILSTILSFARIKVVTSSLSSAALEDATSACQNHDELVAHAVKSLCGKTDYHTKCHNHDTVNTKDSCL